MYDSTKNLNDRRELDSIPAPKIVSCTEFSSMGRRTREAYGFPANPFSDNLSTSSAVNSNVIALAFYDDCVSLRPQLAFGDLFLTCSACEPVRAPARGIAPFLITQLIAIADIFTSYFSASSFITSSNGCICSHEKSLLILHILSTGQQGDRETYFRFEGIGLAAEYFPVRRPWPRGESASTSVSSQTEYEEVHTSKTRDILLLHVRHQSRFVGELSEETVFDLVGCDGNALFLHDLSDRSPAQYILISAETVAG